jgi:hypothetical protein
MPTPQSIVTRFQQQLRTRPLQKRRTKPSTQKLVGFGLATYMNTHTGRAWPGNANLAEGCDLSERVVGNALADLVDEGLLLREFKGSGRGGKASVYVATPSGIPQSASPIPVPQPEEIAHPGAEIAHPERVNTAPCVTPTCHELVKDQLEEPLTEPLNQLRISERRGEGVGSSLEPSNVHLVDDAWRAAAADAKGRLATVGARAQSTSSPADRRRHGRPRGALCRSRLFR